MAEFIGTAGDDTFIGDGSNDTASGNAGNDSLSGGPGSDGLIGGPGADTLDGGAGDDFLYAADTPQPITAYLPFAETIGPRLDRGADVDVLRGGDGSDRIFAGYGDSVDGGTDGFTGDSLYLSLQGAPNGLDIVFQSSSMTIGGGVIAGIDALKYVEGTLFNDKLDLRQQRGGYFDGTTVAAGTGDDTILAGSFSSALYGEAGDDLIDGRTDGGYLDVIDGGDGADILFTRPQSSTEVFGGAGRDQIYAYGPAHGGAGDDVIFMQDGTFDAAAFGDDGDDQITAAKTFYHSYAVAGGNGADTLTGSAGNDVLISASTTDFDLGTERDRLTGGAGDDLLSIGWGDDADGGAGQDRLQVSLAGRTSGYAFDTADVVGGKTLILGGGVIQNMEALTQLRGTEYNDVLTLRTQSVLLTVDAGAGDDFITAEWSAVRVIGGDGDDWFVSGSAGDVFYGRVGFDTVDYSRAASGVTVDLPAARGGGGDTLAGVEGVVGSAFADTVHGGVEANRFDGAGGNDSLFGGLGDDTITDSLGSNYLRGEEGNDVLAGGGEFDDIQGNMGNDTEHGWGGRDWVVGGKDNDVLYGDDGDDVINGNLGADVCEGGEGADTLRGGQGDDAVFGGAGNDWLSGDLGEDTIIGGAGADTFHGFAGIGIDRIMDFSQAEGDRVLLDPGTNYTVSQVGSNTVVDIAGGGQIVLAGVQLASLTAGWIGTA